MTAKNFKYQAVVDELRRAIDAGEYRENLPSVRLLGELFDVNNRTILRALQELTAQGVILQNGNRGFLINRSSNRRPVTDNLVVYVQNPSPSDPRCRNLPSPLEATVTAAGKRLISISSMSPELLSMRSFWESISADGVIFLNSSLSQDAAYQLKLSGIPFVAANRMPREWGVNFVDFAHETALELLFTRLLRAHHKRVALILPHYTLRYFREIFFSVYRRIMTQYAVFDPELFRVPKEGETDEAHIIASFRELLALPQPPSAIYLAVNLPHYRVRELLAESGVILPESFELYCAYSAGIVEDAPLFPGLQYDYQELMLQLWELLREVLAEPDRTPEGRLIPPTLIHADGSPWQGNPSPKYRN